VFRCFAVQAQEAAAVATLADEEADDADGMDRTLDPDELMPGGVFLMVGARRPANVLPEGYRHIFDNRPMETSLGR
jgi:hypothetical protein